MSGWTQPVPDGDSVKPSGSRAAHAHLYNRVTAQLDADIRMIPTGEVIYELMAAADAGKIPGLTSGADFYRDPIHMSYGVGRYTASVTMLATIYSNDLTGVGSDRIAPETTNAINAVVWDVLTRNAEFTGVPEPGSLGLLGGLALLMPRRRHS
jgi:hypothetical protein